MNNDQSKRELLKDKVIDLVKEFIKTEGGISPNDIQFLFGMPYVHGEVATALSDLPIRYDFEPN